MSEEIEFEVTHNEAPYQVSFLGLTSGGWDCIFVIRSMTEDGLTTSMGSLIARLEGYGVQPISSGKHINSNGNQPQHSAQPEQPEPPPNFADAPQVDPGYCPIHQVSMRKWEKDGRSWYSHKIEGTDNWCKGK